MNHPETDRLSDLLDGELSPHEAEALEAHLGSCDECAILLRELSDIKRQARALPDQMPERDLWPEISRSIRVGREEDPQVIALHPPTAQAATLKAGGGIRLSYFQAAAAGLVLALFSGAAGAALSASSEAPPQVVAETGDPWVEVLTMANPGLGEVATEVGQLEALLNQNRNRIDPATAVILEDNLVTIDQAIRECLRALESDPENPFLEEHLTRSVLAKADYLREATSFVVSMD